MPITTTISSGYAVWLNIRDHGWKALRYKAQPLPDIRYSDISVFNIIGTLKIETFPSYVEYCNRVITKVNHFTIIDTKSETLFLITFDKIDRGIFQLPQIKDTITSRLSDSILGFIPNSDEILERISNYNVKHVNAYEPILDVFKNHNVEIRSNVRFSTSKTFNRSLELTYLCKDQTCYAPIKWQSAENPKELLTKVLKHANDVNQYLNQLPKLKKLITELRAVYSSTHLTISSSHLKSSLVFLSTLNDSHIQELKEEKNILSIYNEFKSSEFYEYVVEFINPNWKTHRKTHSISCKGITIRFEDCPVFYLPIQLERIFTLERLAFLTYYWFRKFNKLDDAISAANVARINNM